MGANQSESPRKPPTKSESAWATGGHVCEHKYKSTEVCTQETAGTLSELPQHPYVLAPESHRMVSAAIPLEMPLLSYDVMCSQPLSRIQIRNGHLRKMLWSSEKCATEYTVLNILNNALNILPTI